MLILHNCDRDSLEGLTVVRVNRRPAPARMVLFKVRRSVVVFVTDLWSVNILVSTLESDRLSFSFLRGRN